MMLSFADLLCLDIIRYMPLIVDASLPVPCACKELGAAGYDGDSQGFG